MCRLATRYTERLWSNKQRHCATAGPFHVGQRRSCMHILWQLLVIHVAAAWCLLRASADVVTPTECCFLCIAHCLKNSRDATLDSCKDDCFRYSFSESCLPNSSICWKSLTGSICRHTSDAPRYPPFNLEVQYHEDPYPEPYVVELTWSAVQLADFYAIEYKDMDYPFSSFGLEEVMFVRQPYATFRKPRLCPTYGFRVAAVNRFGMTNFSDVEQISAPIPQPTNTTYWISDIRMADMPFEAITGEVANRSVVITVEFNMPPNWNATDVVKVTSDLHWLPCSRTAKDAFFDHKFLLSVNESKVYVLLPDFAVQYRCSVIFSIRSMESRCNTVFNYPLELPHTTIPGLRIKLGCDSVHDSRCMSNEAYNPLCALQNFTYEKLKVKNDSSSVDVSLGWVFEAPTNVVAPVRYYLIRVNEVTRVKEDFTFFFAPKVIRRILEDRICPGSPGNRSAGCNYTVSNYLVRGLTVGRRYSVHVCAIYDERTEVAIKWNITARHEVDLGTVVHERIMHESQAPHVAFFVVPTLLVVLTALCSAFVIYRCRSAYKKSISELAADSLHCSPEENPYVVQPRRFDHWEISRSKLDIFLDQKLGSGAFGAVYKGKMNGRLVSNKLSNSVFAANWTKTEDCEIAVKMLPEYADETAKSDFCKEINLMKQLGYHEKLVNMLACITADEPLCLIVEYCSDGDLLHYLRDRRKYMVKLEQLGIDISNTENHADMDFDKLLCLKDLVSFAWQICVGLEYLSQKGYVHRDVAARNVLVDRDKRMKIGDFGLCRYVYSDMVYMGKGGRLPVKWMALEAIKNCEFTSKSDVWSFGVLLFEIITLGGSPYPGVQPMDMEKLLEDGHRMEQPVNCPNDMYSIMLHCWQNDPSKRPDFTDIRERLRDMLEKITEDYGYTGLSQSRDYYNVVNSDGSESTGDTVDVMEQMHPTVATGSNIPCAVVG
uniref:receptor protein-tyrosine kinase n=1 Tax=Trichuris muris TaxID=70415 RepID=A0A5S6QVB4_TRIMR